MVEYHSRYVLWSRRIRCGAIVGLTSISLIAGESLDVRADWPLAKRKQPVETAEAKQANDFNNAVRKLLVEAKSHADRGELDRAIHLADRAAKISESSANLVRCAPDVSPAATANFANELRLQRSDHLKRQGGSALTPESIARNRMDSTTAPTSNIGQQPLQSRSATAANGVAQTKSPVGSLPEAQSPHKSEAVASKPGQTPAEVVDRSAPMGSPAPTRLRGASPLLAGAGKDVATLEELNPSPELSEIADPSIAASAPSQRSVPDEFEFSATSDNPSALTAPSEATLTANSDLLSPPPATAAPQISIEERNSGPNVASDSAPSATDEPTFADQSVEKVAQNAEADKERPFLPDGSQTLNESKHLTEMPAVSTPIVKLRERRREVDASQRAVVDEPGSITTTQPITSMPIVDAVYSESLSTEGRNAAKNDSLPSTASEGSVNLKLRSRFSGRNSQSVDDTRDVKVPAGLDATHTDIAGAASDEVKSKNEHERQADRRRAPSPPAEKMADKLEPEAAPAGLKLRTRYQERTSQKSDQPQTDAVSQHRTPQQEDGTVYGLPSEQVHRLQRQLEAKAALNPGAPVGVADQFSESVAADLSVTNLKSEESASSDFRIRNTIKLRKAYDMLSFVTPVSAEASTKQPGVTAKIPASAPTDLPATAEVHDPKGMSDPTSTVPELVNASGSNSGTDTVHRTPFRLRKQKSATGENATSPPPSSPFGNVVTSDPGSQVAPLPPKTDKVASASPHRSAHRSAPLKASSSGLQSKRDSISISLGSAAASTSEYMALTSTNPSGSTVLKRKSATFEDDQAVMSRAILANGPIERFARFFNLPQTTAASTLGVIGVVMLIAGLWLISATLRINPTSVRNVHANRRSAGSKVR